jgi:hypothetical protein
VDVSQILSGDVESPAGQVIRPPGSRIVRPL